MGFRVKPEIRDILSRHDCSNLQGYEQLACNMQREVEKCAKLTRNDGNLLARLEEDGKLWVSRQNWYLYTTLTRAGIGGSVDCINDGEKFLVAANVSSFSFVPNSDGRFGLQYHTHPFSTEYYFTPDELETRLQPLSRRIAQQVSQLVTIFLNTGQ
ncbi:MAG: hypothetical protein A3I05_09900 [Deltaproteobacteria bacterium RIFCSPLOWO2_02_FULL_44_10]|nr:MAG: hypothetical protein A3C46_09285 [Deltaproteobacteria bacterium RIFCSPHIGHO2_02_FULL_44_16]OGQ45006.1 MAG: hypothetical protein A3I05_09900 [Deltaproteobacteria bacterium RIFCSPLOWO2_02_FULL_44_10]